MEQWDLLMISIWLVNLPTLTAQSITISEVPSFIDARGCVRWCLDTDDYYNFHVELECYTDKCLCQPDLRLKASSWLSSCLYTHYAECGNKAAETSAYDIFNTYCGFSGPATVYASSSATPNTAANGVVTVTREGPTTTIDSSSVPGAASSTRARSEFVLLIVTTALVCVGALSIFSL
jgi:hypothetical protein